MTKITYVVLVLVVPLSADGELQRAMSGSVEVQRMDWRRLAVGVEGLRVANEDRARRRRKMDAGHQASNEG